MMEGGANEVRYKIAEFLLKRMHEDKLLTEEEWEKIRVLNVKTFLPRTGKSISVITLDIYEGLCGSVCC